MNFVVITLDTLRYDFVGANGNDWIRTPNLDRFARQAVCFDRAYAGSFPTVPYRTDVFTGRFGRPFHPWAPLAWEAVTLPELMRNAGFVTMLVHDTPHLVNYGFGFDRPFHGWEMIRGQEVDRYRTDKVTRKDLKFDPDKMRFADTFGAQSVRNFFDFAAEEDHCTPRLFQTAARWLERNREHERFFLWIDSFSPHEPWDPPQHYVDLYDPGYEGEVLTFPRYGSVAHLPEHEVRHMRALYAGLVTMTDRWVGYFLDHLDLLGLAEDTVVIIDSDHGTYAGDRLMAGKEAPHYQEICHTVHMMRLPGKEAARTEAIWQPADLMPTVLELAGVDLPADLGVQGVSAAPLLRGEPAPARDIAVTAGAIVQPQPGAGHAAITAGDWAFFDYPDPARRQLFDLRNDPGQERNVIDDHRAVAADLHDAFIEFLTKHEANPHLIAYWKGDAAALEAAIAAADTPAYASFRGGQQRGLGLTPRSFVRSPEFGQGKP